MKMRKNEIDNRGRLRMVEMGKMGKKTELRNRQIILGTQEKGQNMKNNWKENRIKK